MILKKPYAFLIKNFKLLHIIMTVFIVYLIYRTNLLLSFFNQYIGSSEIVTGNDLTGKLFHIFMFIIPFLIILTSIIVLSVMYIKKKPFLFYVINILICAAIVIMYTVAYSTLGNMEVRIIDVRTVRVVRDLLMMLFALQCISVVITFIRATGFDIKKFHFGEDLQQIEVTTTDNEEFEFEVNIDTNRLQRKVNRRFRYMKYTYLENKFLFHMAFLVIIAISCFLLYLNLGVYNKTYQKGETVLLNGYFFRLNASYLVDSDEVGREMKPGYSYVVLDVSVRSNSTTPVKFPSTRAELKIGDRVFHHISTYHQKMEDLGITYNEDLLTNQFKTYLLVYEVPNSLKNAKMSLRYIDKMDITRGKLNPKYVKINLQNRDLTTVKSTKEIKVGEDLDLSDSIFKKTLLKISKAEIKTTWKEPYQFCIHNEECYNSYEYIKPSLLNTEPKAVLKLTASMVWQEDLVIDKSTDVFRFIERFGTLYYEKDGKKVKIASPFTRIIPRKIKESNTYYLEVSKDLETIWKTNKIWISFHIRDRDYQYLLN